MHRIQILYYTTPEHANHLEAVIFSRQFVRCVLYMLLFPALFLGCYLQLYGFDTPLFPDLLTARQETIRLFISLLFSMSGFIGISVTCDSLLCGVTRFREVEGRAAWRWLDWGLAVELQRAGHPLLQQPPGVSYEEYKNRMEIEFWLVNCLLNVSIYGIIYVGLCSVFEVFESP
ncbi:hypothetical protein B7494_g371 [Chlorociboria aeruginascens]|nr:hypothetical protein B7494_g371 [Chlorociboria aeruginascens]